MVTTAYRQLMEERPQTTRVERLRVRGVSLDATTASLRLSHTLAAADAHPLGLPPSAVLIVRRLADPAPGTLSLRRSHGAPIAWQAALREALARAYRHAVRVRPGYAPSGADAVLFMDEAELIASLALDIVRGRASSQWWWRAHFGGASPTQHSLPRLLVERAEYTPAAFAHLEAAGVDAEVARALTPEQALSVASAACRAHQADDTLLRERAAARTRGDPVAERSAEPALVTALPVVRPSPAEPAGFRPEHVTLLRVMASLGRPARARALGARLTPPAGAVPTAGFGPGPRLAEEPASRRGDGAAPPGEAPLTIRPSARNHMVDTPGLQPIWPEVAGDETSVETPDEPTPPTPKRSTAQPLDSLHYGADETRLAAGDTCDSPATENLASPATESPRAPGPRAAPEAVRAIETTAQRTARASEPLGPPGLDDGAAPTPPPWDGAGVETGLAGVFFLINVMAHLDLPDVFEADWRLSSEAGTWGTLALLGRSLLDADDRSVGDDLLWSLLAGLHDRDTAIPVLGVPAAGYRIPASWLSRDASGPGALYWHAGDGHLRLWSEHGYLLRDQPDGGSPERALGRALRELGLAGAEAGRSAPYAEGFVPGRLLEGITPGTERWLRCVLPFVRRRLHLALGAGESTSALLVQRARVYTTSTHVDVVMRLDDVSIPARLAGLDRDPGWLPRFGRVIKFYFE